MTEEFTTRELEFTKFVQQVEKAMQNIGPQTTLMFATINIHKEAEGISTSVSFFNGTVGATLGIMGYMIARFDKEAPVNVRPKARRLLELFRKLFNAQPTIILSKGKLN